MQGQSPSEDPFSAESRFRSDLNRTDQFSIVNQRIKDTANEFSSTRKGDILADTYGNFKYRPADQFYDPNQ